MIIYSPDIRLAVIIALFKNIFLDFHSLIGNVAALIEQINLSPENWTKDWGKVLLS
jgi:hypothetical protein